MKKKKRPLNLVIRSVFIASFSVTKYKATVPLHLEQIDQLSVKRNMIITKHCIEKQMGKIVFTVMFIGLHIRIRIRVPVNIAIVTLKRRQQDKYNKSIMYHLIQKIHCIRPTLSFNFSGTRTPTPPTKEKSVILSSITEPTLRTAPDMSS